MNRTDTDIVNNTNLSVGPQNVWDHREASGYAAPSPAFAITGGVPLDVQNLPRAAGNTGYVRGSAEAHLTGIFSTVTSPQYTPYRSPGDYVQVAAPATPWQSENEAVTGVMNGERLLYREGITAIDYKVRNGSKTQAGQEPTFYCTGAGVGKCVFCTSRAKSAAEVASSVPPSDDVPFEFSS